MSSKDNPIQIKILEYINQNPRSSPLLISKELDTPSTSIRAILTHFSKLGMVETLVKGSYIITSLGKSFLKQRKELKNTRDEG